MEKLIWMNVPTLMIHSKSLQTNNQEHTSNEKNAAKQIKVERVS